MNRAYGEFADKAWREWGAMYKARRTLGWYRKPVKRLTRYLDLTGEKLDAEILEVVKKALKVFYLSDSNTTAFTNNEFLTLYALLMEADVSRLDHPSVPLRRYVEVACHYCDSRDIECARRFLLEGQDGPISKRFAAVYKKAFDGLSGWQWVCYPHTQYFITHGTREPPPSTFERWAKIDAESALDHYPDVKYLFV